MKRHDPKLAAKLYARHSPIDQILESGKAIQTACEALAVDPGIKKADDLLHQIKRH